MAHRNRHGRTRGTTGALPVAVDESPESRLKRQLGWLIGLRLVAVTSVVLPYFLARLSAPSEQIIYDYLLRSAGAVYVASLVYLAMLVFERPRPARQAYVQFAGDLLLITGLVYISGGTSSPFSILYLLIITLASALSRRRVGVAVATAAWLLYAVLVVGLFLEWFAAPDLAGRPSLQSLLYHLAVHALAFHAVALLTSHVAHDVARVEKALEMKREHLADLQVAHNDVLESIPSGLITTDGEGRILSANVAAQDILGVATDGLVGNTVMDIGLFGAAVWLEVKKEATRSGRRRLEAEHTRGERSFPIGYSVSELRRADGGVAGYIVIFQDLSEWRQLQEELRLKDRMAAVGGMASGLAHEIGNPLAAISGSVQMLSSTLPPDSAQSKLLAIIHKESERLDRTIKGFLRFARPRDSQKREIDIAALLSENVELLRNSPELGADHRIELELELGSTTATVIADSDQISQIFWNLARNALRAMTEGGVLRIAGDVRGDTYCVHFTDTGRGMKEEERAHLFDPFRSFFDGGTGIGMAIVYRIVEEHGGRLQVESRHGHGTTVTVELPRCVPVSEPVPMEA